MAERPMVIVPDVVGQPVDIAGETAAAIGLILSSGDLDGPGIRARTWPGLFWVTSQDPQAGAIVERGSPLRVTFVEDGQARSDVPAQSSGPLPSLESHADDDPDERLRGRTYPGGDF
ncbi:PASTA domain-containing protein [Microbacterium sp. NPDC028030]|uniref:PASTA domain-containing protein n=1 Tax=Microbacterium sp. NPDC028030 TaxID=3155124 RepID=UPI0033DDD304